MKKELQILSEFAIANKKSIKGRGVASDWAKVGKEVQGVAKDLTDGTTTYGDNNEVKFDQYA